MVRTVLVLNGNPDPKPERLSSALAKAYGDAARQAGHNVHHIDLGTLGFPILHEAAAFFEEPKNEAIVDARRKITQAHHLVFVFPLWLGAPPALLKVFMEQVACGGFALQTGAGGVPKPQLKGRSARLIVTMGRPVLAYRFWYGAHGVKAFAQSILGISGIKPIATSHFWQHRRTVALPQGDHGGGDVGPPSELKRESSARNL